MRNPRAAELSPIPCKRNRWTVCRRPVIARCFRRPVAQYRLRLRRLLAGRHPSVVLLSVADNGAGVGEQELGRLFERFYRGDRARTTHGTGLGLAIVKHIVTQAGGDVEARRGPGRLGLEIRCTFPG